MAEAWTLNAPSPPASPRTPPARFSAVWCPISAVSVRRTRGRHWMRSTSATRSGAAGHQGPPHRARLTRCDVCRHA